MMVRNGMSTDPTTPTTNAAHDEGPDVSFRAAWDAWRQGQPGFDRMSASAQAGVRLGFLSGWRAAREAGGA
jgi:hypothetical protein